MLVVVVVIAASCGDDGDKAGGGTGEGSVAEAGKAPGVTETSIKVGVTYPDLEAIRDVIVLDYGDYEATFQALFDDINENGGIHGRTLEPVFAAVNPIGPDGFNLFGVQVGGDHHRQTAQARRSIGGGGMGIVQLVDVHEVIEVRFSHDGGKKPRHNGAIAIEDKRLIDK